MLQQLMVLRKIFNYITLITIPPIKSCNFSSWFDSMNRRHL
ncbi:hypothetical protein DCCM_2985 [Desulfocucumis palustris]|uniref:Uncharacterized protein n=1 Tax=Desulfocucumis palustris TaxID=1898651 RepID=A0A2L2XCZ3_9FIRM|nr:hypothetical protein DCCM_2985 [Desulfocucumis palustris]